MNRAVAIVFAREKLGLIYFWASIDSVKDFEGFGKLSMKGHGECTLWVDPRYDFKQVVEYIKNYG